MRRDLERLQDMLEAIDRIQQHTGPGRAAFDLQPLVQVWVVHHLGIVGEACRSVSPELRGRHPEVPWSAIIGMRNTLVHTTISASTLTRSGQPLSAMSRSYGARSSRSSRQSLEQPEEPDDVGTCPTLVEAVFHLRDGMAEAGRTGRYVKRGSAHAAPAVRRDMGSRP